VLGRVQDRSPTEGRAGTTKTRRQRDLDSGRRIALWAIAGGFAGFKFVVGKSKVAEEGGRGFGNCGVFVDSNRVDLCGARIGEGLAAAAECKVKAFNRKGRREKATRAQSRTLCFESTDWTGETPVVPSSLLS
jgi:hypothetical protein